MSDYTTSTSAYSDFNIDDVMAAMKLAEELACPPCDRVMGLRLNRWFLDQIPKAEPANPLAGLYVTVDNKLLADTFVEKMADGSEVLVTPYGRYRREAERGAK